MKRKGSLPRPLQPQKQVQYVALACLAQTRQPQNLARPHGKVQPRQMRRGQLFSADHLCAQWALARRIGIAHVAARHVADHLILVGVACGGRADMPAIAQNGDVVAQVHHLIHTVRDV